MGYNTAVLILNDALSTLRENPKEFVEKLVEAIAPYARPRSQAFKGQSFGVGNHANPVQVMMTEHADVPRLYVSHGNLMIDLGSPSIPDLDPRDLEIYKDYLKMAENIIKLARHDLSHLKDNTTGTTLE